MAFDTSGRTGSCEPSWLWSDSEMNFALGLDVGGTAARWAVVDATGAVQAEGTSPGWSAAAWGTPGQPALEAAVRACAQAVRRSAEVHAMLAGVTGFDADSPDAAVLQRFVAEVFDMPVPAVALMGDVALACSAHFAPGQGIALIAGTGSIAAHLDAQGQLQRAGGRGVLLDDAGGGYWIAREALRLLWRREDEAPGAGEDSALGRSLFARLGGNDWATTRSFMARAARGDIGALAVAVAEAAQQGDDDALALLRQAGTELARLVHAMHQRVGPQPVVAVGRVFDLHPTVMQGLQGTLPSGITVQRSTLNLSVAAAQLAR
jgi:glucosamine kinase